MKLIRIFGLVFGLHVFVISLLFILPACQTTPEVAKSSDTSASSSVRSYEPVTEDTPSGELDSSFNAGLPDETPSTNRTGRYAPTRMEGDFEGYDSDMSTLQPLRGEFEPTMSTYKVKRGDTLWAIADRHGISLDDLLEVNGFDRDETIYEGDEIDVPVYPSSSVREDYFDGPTGMGESSVEYTVQRGDTLSGIAVRAGITVERLKRNNELTGDTIYAGQNLYLPLGTSVESLKATETPVKGGRKEREPGRGETIHTVVRGETPSGIAAQYGMETLELMRRNRITDPTKLKVGRKLIVGGEDEDSPPSLFSRNRSSFNNTEEKEPEPPEIKPMMELPLSLEELNIRDDDEIEIPVVPIEPDEEE